MLPLVLLSDVEVGQKISVNFDSFPTTMFLPQLSPNSQSLPKPFRISANSCKEEDWKGFFEQYKNSNCPEDLTSLVTPSSIDESKEKSVELFLTAASSSKQHIDLEQSSQHKIDQSRVRKHDQQNMPENSNNNHKTDLIPTSSDPYNGLADFIRKKNKKQFLCERCGSTHSNCVKAKSQMSVRGQHSRRQRLNRIQSAGSPTTKVIIICPNCGKRSHSSASKDRFHGSNFCRAMTWPLRLERIMEDECEGHCCTMEGCNSEIQTLEAVSFCPSNNSRLKTKHKCSQQCLDEKMVTCGDDNNNRIRKKILIVNLCPAAHTFVNKVRKWSVDGYDDEKLIRFLTMETRKKLKSHSPLTRKNESRAMPSRISDDDFCIDPHDILEVAKANSVQGVWLNDDDLMKCPALQNLLTDAGIFLLSPTMSLKTIGELLTYSCQNGLKNSSYPPGQKISGPVCESNLKITNNQTIDAFVKVALLCTTTHIAERTVASRIIQYKNALKKKDVLPPSYLKATEKVKLVHLNSEYQVQATKVSSSCFFLSYKNCSSETVITKLSNDGWLLSLDGTMHSTCFKEFSACYQITVDKQVFIFGKASDSRLHNSDDRIVQKQPGKTNQCWLLSKIEAPCLDESSHKPTTSKQQSHQVMDYSLTLLHSVMDGWCYPDAVFEMKTLQALEELTLSLSDPSLPLQQMQEALTKSNGPFFSLEKLIRKELFRYASNLTSMVAQFPGRRIQKIIDSFAEKCVDKSQEEAFYLTTEPLTQVAQRFSNGIRGHKRTVLLSLLRKYFLVEEKFQTHGFNESVLLLLNDADVHSVLNDVQSHIHVQQKNIVALQIIDSLTKGEQNLSEEVLSVLGSISQLTNENSSKVALKAKQVLRNAKKTSYELRYNQMESLFLSLVCCSIEKLVQSISDIDALEILPHFFCHYKSEVKMAAMEMYVRRAYTTLLIHSLLHHQVTDNHSAVLFSYMPSSGNTPCNDDENTPFHSPDKIDPNNVSVLHLAVITAFPDLVTFEESFEQVLQLFHSSSFLQHPDVHDVDDSSSNDSHRSLIVTITTTNDVDNDAALSLVYKEFLVSHETQLRQVNLHQMSFLLFLKNQRRKSFVFNLSKQEIVENQVLRHVDPPLASRIESIETKHLHLKPLQVKENLHLYLTSNIKDEENIHVMATVRNESVDSSNISLEHFENEVELFILESLHEFEDLQPNMSQHPKNLFVNIIKNVEVDVQLVREKLRSIILRYGKRLWRKKVKEIDVCYGSRCDDLSDDFSQTVCAFLHSESRCSVH